MGFDANKFMAQSYTLNTKDIPVPTLKPFFTKKTPAIFKVRGLSGVELAQVHDAVNVNKGIKEIVEKIVSPLIGERVKAIQEAIGITTKTPDEIVRRLEMLVKGSLNPAISLDVAVKICETYPIEFYDITNEISKLTGQGKVLGKLKPSGEAQK